MTTDPAKAARLDQLYAEFSETLERLAPIAARYREALLAEGVDRHTADDMVRAMQDAFLGRLLSNDPSS